MSEALASAARELIRLASPPVNVGHRSMDHEALIIVPANTVRWLTEALTPEEREPYPFVSVAPGMCWGQPTISGSRLTVSTIAEHVWAGQSFDQIQHDWDYLRRGDVLVACWFTAHYGGRTWKKRWKRWADTVSGQLWACTTVDYEQVAWPPTEQENASATLAAREQQT